MAATCFNALSRCSPLHTAAFRGDVRTIQAQSLHELLSIRGPCCFRNASLAHMTCWGGSVSVFITLIEKGAICAVNPRAKARLAFGMELDMLELAKLAKSARLVELLERGYLKQPPPWSIVRLLFIGEKEPSSAFGPVPKDVVRLIARQLISRVYFVCSDKRKPC